MSFTENKHLMSSDFIDDLISIQKSEVCKMD